MAIRYRTGTRISMFQANIDGKEKSEKETKLLYR
jgi:hypothetical protein